ncbi:RagB/SusD family nutrient uptake outer membrane protein [Dysgonomonas sp. 521]|uniref:RagB/SusD family nutrient uptake outer membrane protein n=1 Tax=Dysgonomonas sp. 521 TaxID=2302932 RepID=UPI0013D6BA52|nr:RagB/SusD family nutrient uptake outer membrane protein [Dysgonomonas sp. 521]NDV95654.1 RagB/SusD family nutrient uptake outer membrane protein [Dysgonomonas sp. 521]
MKRFSFYSIVYLICGIICLACSDFLDEKPKDQIPEDEAYKTLQSLYLNTVASMYSHVGGYENSQGLQGTTRGIYDFNTLTTDEAMIPTRGGDWYDGGFWQRLYLHTWGVQDQSLRATWEYLYKVIILSNKSIETLQASKDKFDKIQIDKYIAEVRAFRAIYYYYLLDMFARVPVTTSSSIPINEIEQSNRKEVFDFIVKELQESVSLLSKERSNQFGEYYGRITQPVVYFVLAKMALNAEVFTDNDWTDGSRRDGNPVYFSIDGVQYNAWQATIVFCDKIKDMGYRLSPDYEDNFIVFNESSVENIFIIPMDKRSYTNQMQYLFRSLHYNHSKALGFGSENGTSATLDALRIFGYGTDNVDPRFEKNYHAGIIYDLNGNQVKDDMGNVLEYFPSEIKLDLSGSLYEKMAGARMKKYAIDKTNIKDGKLIDNDIVLYRYADVLLMKSEAKVRNGESGDAELNEVRARAGAAYRTATLDNIFDERLLELAWEGWRRQDMIRFGKYHEAYSQRPQLHGEASGYTTVFPIPQSILDLNPNLTQNMGY